MNRFRLPLAFVVGLALTGGMFWFLWILINVPLASQEVQKAQKVEFTRLRRDSDVKTIKKDKPQLVRPVAAPVQPQVAKATFSRAGTEVVPANLLAAPGIDTKAGLGLTGGVSLGTGGLDRDVLPLVRINPDYPPRAQSRGIQGWVLVQFTITPAGTVADAKVIDAQPKGMFDDAAVKAVSRWKYNPKVEGGVAVERRGIQVKLTFQLET